MLQFDTLVPAILLTLLLLQVRAHDDPPRHLPAAAEQQDRGRPVRVRASQERRRGHETLQHLVRTEEGEDKDGDNDDSDVAAADDDDNDHFLVQKSIFWIVANTIRWTGKVQNAFR